MSFRNWAGKAWLRFRGPDTFEQWRSAAWSRIAHAGFGHWLVVLAVLLVGVWVSHLLQRHPTLVELQQWVYRELARSSPDDRNHASRAVVVMIGDAEYGSPELKRRKPLNRKYLAELVTAIGKAVPNVIALDVDFTANDGDIADFYPGETKELRTAIATKVLDSTTVVIPFTIREKDGRYIRNEGLLDGLKDEPNVRFGSVAVAPDRSLLGLRVPVDGEVVDSFSTAIARAVDPQMIRKREQQVRDLAVFTTFLPDGGVEIVPAGAVRAGDPAALAKLQHKVVIVGGNWKTEDGNSRVDQHSTPSGTMAGAVLNANYVEALLAVGGAKKPVSRFFAFLMELIATLLVALICLVFVRWWMKLLWVTVTLVLLVVWSYLIFQNLGGFFDFSIVVPAVAFHAWLERRHQSYSPQAARVRLAAASAGVAVGIVLLLVQHPAAAVHPAAVAQVATLQIRPAVDRLETFEPERASIYGPEVKLASAKTPPQEPQPTPQVPFARPVPAGPAMVHWSAHATSAAAEAAPEPAFAMVPRLTVPVDERAFQTFVSRQRLIDAVERETAAVQKVARAVEIATLNASRTFGNDSTAGKSQSSVTFPWAERDAERARVAFDNACEASTAEPKPLRGATKADNVTPMYTARAAPPQEREAPSFDATWARLQRAAGVLQPARHGFTMSFTAAKSLFAADLTVSQAALDALAHIAVELMADKDLTVTIAARAGGIGDAHRLVIYEVLREMRVERPRIELVTDPSIDEGNVRINLSL